MNVNYTLKEDPQLCEAGNPFFAKPASPKEHTVQQWRDRINVSELQAYKPQMLMQNEPLPNLPRFGS